MTANQALLIQSLTRRASNSFVIVCNLFSDFHGGMYNVYVYHLMPPPLLLEIRSAKGRNNTFHLFTYWNWY